MLQLALLLCACPSLLTPATTAQSLERPRAVHDAGVPLSPGDARPRGGIEFGTATTGSTYCDGSSSGTGCPCGNVGLPGNGCPSGVNPDGASLIATGVPSLAQDTVTLIATGLPARAPVIFFQGSATVSSVFLGDGLLCVQLLIGVSRRASNGEARLGFGITPGQLISTYGLLTTPGTRYYQLWYRNATPGFCTSDTFNATNGLAIDWTSS